MPHTDLHCSTKNNDTIYEFGRETDGKLYPGFSLLQKCIYKKNIYQQSYDYLTHRNKRSSLDWEWNDGTMGTLEDFVNAIEWIRNVVINFVNATNYTFIRGMTIK